MLELSGTLEEEDHQPKGTGFLLKTKAEPPTDRHSVASKAEEVGKHHPPSGSSVKRSRPTTRLDMITHYRNCEQVPISLICGVRGVTRPLVSVRGHYPALENSSESGQNRLFLTVIGGHSPQLHGAICPEHPWGLW